MTAVSQLDLYNGAARVLKEAKLTALTEEREFRRRCDDVWSTNLIDDCLSSAQWYFARRSVQINADPDFTSNFGYQFSFTKPSDWIRTAGFCSDPYFNIPNDNFVDEGGHWFCDSQPIYVRYISNDAKYGNNLALWPAPFQRYVESYLALQVAPGLTSDDALLKVVAAINKDRLDRAKGIAAQQEGAAFPPVGRWARARYGRRAFTDRGSTNNLIG